MDAKHPGRVQPRDSSNGQRVHCGMVLLPSSWRHKLIETALPSSTSDKPMPFEPKITGWCGGYA